MRRLLHFVFVLFGITFLSFALIHMAGSDAVLQQMDVTGVALSREAIDVFR